MRAPVLTPLAPLLLIAACSADVPGSEAGQPCNNQGICATGLTCQSGTCRAEGEIEPEWELMLTPVESKLYGVWGRGKDDVLACGESGVLLRYTGSGLDWQRVDHQLTKSGLYAIWGRGGDIWVGGNDTILHSTDGATWSAQELIDGSSGSALSKYTIRAIAGSDKAVYAVGQLGSSAQYGGLVARLDGQRWVSIPGAALSFTGQGLLVEGSGVHVVGNAKHVKHFDGASWIERNLAERADLRAIAKVGEALIAAGPAKQLYRLAGDGDASWEKLDDARASYVAHALYRSGEALYIAGEGNRSYAPAKRTTIERCDSELRCATSFVVEDASDKAIRAIWGSGDGVLFAAGDSGIILRHP